MKDKIITFIFGIGAATAPILLFFLLIHIIEHAYPALIEIGPGLFELSGRWQPVANNPSFSLLPIILGTLYISILAVLFAIPIGFGCAVFLEFYCDKRIARAVLVLIDLLAGVPSVIFGFLGMVVLLKWFERLFSMTSGECVLAAAVLLAIMLLPYVISNCTDSIRKAGSIWMESAHALGFSKEYTISKIIFPGVRLGIASSVIMAFGRALGETMAVMMVVGNSPIFPKLLGRGETIAGLTALEIGSAEYGSLHMSAIYAANLFLLVLLIIILAIVRLLKKQMEER